MLTNLRTGRLYLRAEEKERALQEAEERAVQEAQARQALEAEIARLRLQVERGPKD